MNGNIIAKLECNSKTYVYYIFPDKPKNLLYGYIENEVIRPVVDPNDIAIMQEAYKKIFISIDPDNHIKLAVIKHNGKSFQKMYDKISGLVFFYEIKDSKYYYPNNEDAIDLFDMFNRFELYKNVNGDNLPKKPKTLKKIIISLAAAAGIATVGYALYDYFLQPYFPTSPIIKKIDELIPDKKNKTEFSEEKIREAINSNNNLSEEEKAFFLEEIPYLVKNQKYVNMDMLLIKLKLAKIIYKQEGNRNFNGISFFNIITMHGCSGFDDAPKSLLRHELRHLFSWAYGFGVGTFEATTEEITGEYFKNYSYFEEAYSRFILLQRALYEIVGTEPFAAFEESGDIYHIINALMKIIPDEKQAIELISTIDDMYVYYTKVCSHRDGEEAWDNLFESENNAIESIGNYFYAAKGHSIKEDAICNLLLGSLGKSNGIKSISVDGENSEDLFPFVYNSFTKNNFFVNADENLDFDYVLSFATYQKCFIGNNNQGQPMFLKIPVNATLEFTKEVKENVKVVDGVLNVDSKYLKDNEIIFGNGISKGVNELLFSESNIENVNNLPKYNEQSTYIKILCEIIGPEPFKNYQNTGDINEILNPLLSIIPDKEKALRLIGCIDLTTAYHDFQTSDMEKDDPDIGAMPGDVDQNICDARSEIYASLEDYFKAVKGYSIKDDMIASVYYGNLADNFSFDNDKSLDYMSYTLEDWLKQDSDGYKNFSIEKSYFGNGDELVVLLIKPSEDDPNQEIKKVVITEEMRQIISSYDFCKESPVYIDEEFDNKL